MDKDLAITVIMMVLSSMQPTVQQEAGITSSPMPVIAQHVNRSYPNKQRLHDQQGCGNFVVYG